MPSRFAVGGDGGSAPPPAEAWWEREPRAIASPIVAWRLPLQQKRPRLTMVAHQTHARMVLSRRSVICLLAVHQVGSTASLTRHHHLNEEAYGNSTSCSAWQVG